jgi:lipoprotein-anchoring transpeptidase ErfK/SrfK
MTPILFRLLMVSLLSAVLPFVTAVLIRVETARAAPEPIHRTAITDERDALTSEPLASPVRLAVKANTATTYSGTARNPITLTREPDIDVGKREMRRAWLAQRQAQALIAGIVAQSALTKTWQQGKALLIDQATQQIHVYTAGIEIRVMPISTGERPYYTPPFRGYVGSYVGKIYGYGSWADDAWFLFEARGNIYFHGAPYTLNGDEKIYEGLEQLGVRPSSHGCIRLHPDDARWLTGWNPVGALIVITPLPRL